MNSSTIPVDSDNELLQGDIIRRLAKNTDDSPRWGFILTADCDIFQKKAGHTYSWLEITRAKDFLEQVWCEEQLRSYIKKYSQSCLDPLNSIIRKHHPKLSLLTNDTLYTWLIEDSVNNILSTLLSADTKFDSKVKNLLVGLQNALNRGDTNKLDLLLNCWTHAGIDAKSQIARIRGYLTSNDGFPDFFVVPDLPGEDGFCFIVMLRSISTVDIANIFKTELDAKIAGKSDSFHRIGRFNDNVRYAIVQKFSFLFSRIGMPSHFESASVAATDILVEDIFPGAIQK
jgi:hypothetical protein